MGNKVLKEERQRSAGQWLGPEWREGGDGRPRVGQERGGSDCVELERGGRGMIKRVEKRLVKKQKQKRTSSTAVEVDDDGLAGRESLTKSQSLKLNPETESCALKPKLLAS